MEQLRGELYDMSEKIYELQAKTEHLTNGQRYAAINEIEKSIAPLRNDLHHLEYKLYNQQHNEEEISKEIDRILQQISELENLKSDLVERINTENEHTRKYYHDEVMEFMRDEISPLRVEIINNKNDISDLKKMIENLKTDLVISEKNREIKDAEKFDRIKWIVTGVAAFFGAVGALGIYLQPTIQTFIRIFLGI